MDSETEKLYSEDLETRLEALETKPEEKKSKSGLVLLIVGFFLIIFAVLVFLNFSTLKDYFVGLGYEPSAEMSEIKSSLALTDKADLIFKATFPTLESEENFNESCDSHNSDVSVLGCFSGDKIYIYKIESEELSGILESTTAHELLHAIWSRLKGSEKASLTPVLEEVYKDNRVMLEETLSAYSEEDRLDELYVRVGTQVRNLPEVLETHYGKYFTNRARIVSFYESYVAPFNELKEKIEAQGKELETLKVEIEAETKKYEAESEEFNKAVGEFNACANTLNCFSESAFYARRRELVAREEKLNTMFENLNAKIDDYNFKVEEYNKNVFKSNALQNIINSNSALKELTETNE